MRWVFHTKRVQDEEIYNFTGLAFPHGAGLFHANTVVLASCLPMASQPSGSNTVEFVPESNGTPYAPAAQGAVIGLLTPAHSPVNRAFFW